MGGDEAAHRVLRCMTTSFTGSLQCIESTGNTVVIGSQAPKAWGDLGWLIMSSGKVRTGWHVGQMVTAALAVFGLEGAVVAHADPLEALLPPLLADHERIKAAQSDMESAEYARRGAWGAYLPSVSVTGDYGYERHLKGGGTADTSSPFAEVNVGVDQLVYDFGKTGAAISTADKQQQLATLTLESVRQGLLLEGASAYITLLKAVETLRYARQSEESVKRQTGMEEYRVQRGSGISTDVLQTRAQLAGARATRVAAEGALVTAINRFRNVFRHDVGDLKTYSRPTLPLDRLPATVEDAIAIALDHSLTLKQAALTVEVADQGVRTARSKFYPSVDVSLDYSFKDDSAGTLYKRTEKRAMVEVTYPLFAGGTDYYGYQSAIRSVSSAKDRLAESRRGVEERVRNAWQDLETKRSTAEYLRNQANITGEFLDKARKEQQLGNRSLLDVLSGETNFINTVSAAVAAETDMAISVYTLLWEMGGLDESAFITLPATKETPDTPPTTDEKS